MSPRIDLFEDFVIPENAGMHFTIEALKRLLESPQKAQLWKYFGAIDVFIEEGEASIPVESADFPGRQDVGNHDQGARRHGRPH